MEKSRQRTRSRMAAASRLRSSFGLRLLAPPFSVFFEVLKIQSPNHCSLLKRVTDESDRQQIINLLAEERLSLPSTKGASASAKWWSRHQNAIGVWPSPVRVGTNDHRRERLLDLMRDGGWR
jgi:hypothetical protein